MNLVPEDFEAADTFEKAEQLQRDGTLRKVYLMPLEAGGADTRLNIVFVTPAAADQKIEFDRSAMDLAAGKIYQYEARPVYDGNSFVPNRMMIKVTGEISLGETIEVW